MRVCLIATAALFCLVTTVVAEDAPSPVTVASETGANQPALAVDSEGKLYLAYGAGDPTQIWLRTSTDGKEWSEPTLVSEGAYEAMSGNTRGPRIALIEDTIVVTAFANFRDGEKKHLYCFRKRAKDKKFTAVRVSSDAARDMEGLHDMTVDGNGTMHVVWMEARSGGAEPYYACSTSEGKSFKSEQAVYSAPDGSICPCCAPSISASDDGKTIVIQFRNKLKAADGQYYNDMHAAVSTNKGRKWSTERLDDRDRWKG